MPLGVGKIQDEMEVLVGKSCKWRCYWKIHCLNGGFSGKIHCLNGGFIGKSTVNGGFRWFSWEQ